MLSKSSLQNGPLGGPPTEQPLTPTIQPNLIHIYTHIYNGSTHVHMYNRTTHAYTMWVSEVGLMSKLQEFVTYIMYCSACASSMLISTLFSEMLE
jgi:hypothetical protein